MLIDGAFPKFFDACPAEPCLHSRAAAATKRSDSAAVLAAPDGGRAETMMLMHACVASCTLVRDACRLAYAENKRAMVAPDVLAHLPEALEQICPAPKL